MTADERIEALLNRAGQTISDLPKPTEDQYAYNYAYNREDRKTVYDAIHNWDAFEDQWHSPDAMEDYILHLADIIDRMEAALENTLNKRDFFGWRKPTDKPNIGYEYGIEVKENSGRVLYADYDFDCQIFFNDDAEYLYDGSIVAWRYINPICE